MSKRLAVLGSPIAHSKSPQIQLAALEFLGIEATFERIEVSDLSAFLSGPDRFDALSLTMPLKEQAVQLTSWQHPLVTETNSANYLLPSGNGWRAFNTDVFGIQKAVESVEAKTVGILGTGATARSALTAMAGKELHIWGRKSDLVEKLSGNHGAIPSDLDEVLGCELVISTLPGDALSGLIHSNYPGVLLDVVYSRPSPAGFIRDISGLSMLIWQAIGQLRLLINGADQPLTSEQQMASAMLRAAELAE